MTMSGAVAGGTPSPCGGRGEGAVSADAEGEYA